MPNGNAARQVDRGISQKGILKMKHARIHLPNLSYVAAFIIGVILFAAFWKSWFGSASSSIVLAGMAGVAAVVTIFWLRNELKNSKDKDH
jgi:predicted membrane-bound spermidine synthase